MTAYMFKKVLIILIIFLVLLAVYIRLFGKSSPAPETQLVQQQVASTVPLRIPASVPQTKVRFTPDPLKLKADGTVETQVFLEPSENKVTKVHYEIGYDPKIFAFVSLKPVDVLGGKKVTVNTVDKQTGTIIFEAVINPLTTPPIVGGDETLEITLRPVSNSSQSQLTFLPGTTVTAEGIEGNALVSASKVQVQ
jgi:hypothetical protein